MIRLGWIPWMLMATVVGAAAGLVTAARTPKRYRSEALMIVVPPRIPESYARSTETTTDSARVQLLSQVVLSRTSLEHIINEFGLYGEERQHAFMQLVVEKMNKDVEITLQSDNTLRVGFVGSDASTVMKVTQRLASLVIQESLQDRITLAEHTDAFLHSQLEDLRRRLIEHKQQLNAARQSGSPEAETLAIEDDALRTTFNDLLTRQQEARMSANLERAQLGEAIKVLDPARVAERPFSPDRRIYAGVGAAAGLAAGLLLSIVGRWTRFRGTTPHRALAVDA